MIINHDIIFIDRKDQLFALVLEYTPVGKKSTPIKTVYTVDPQRMVDFRSVLAEATAKFKVMHNLKD